MSSLADLKKEAQALGIKVESKARAPYLDALRNFYLRRDYPSGLPYTELNPMLCYDYWKIHPKQQEAIWKNADWIAQEKLNGCRLIIHFVRGIGVFAHSRTVSAKTYRRTELTDRLLFRSLIPDFTATVDSEVMCHSATGTSNSLETTTALLHMRAEASRRIQADQKCPLAAHVFDMTNWQGIDLRDKKLCERLSYMSDFQTAIQQTEASKYFVSLPVQLHKKKDFYNQVLKSGGEGVVLKNLNAPYEDSSARKRHGWIKVKKQVEVDAFVSGFERGRTGGDYETKVGSLVFSTNTEEGPLVVAKVSNLPWSFRKEVSEYDRETNTVKLDVNCYGRVARVIGLELSRRAGRLVHPRIDYWRSDLNQEQCVYSFREFEAVRKGETGAFLLRIVANIKKTEGT